MGIFSNVRRFFGVPEKHTFAQSPYGYESPAYSILTRGMFWQDGHGRGSTIRSREEAMEIPAVLKARDQICGIATLPLEAVNARNEIVRHPLFEQIDPNVENVTTLSMLLEDLLFDAVGWLKITATDAAGYPTSAIRIDPSQVSLTPPTSYQQGWLPSDLPTTGVIYMNGEPVPWSRVIRFSSPKRPLMATLRRVLLRAIAQDLAALQYAEYPRPADYFTPSDQADPFDDDEQVEELLSKWDEARRARRTAYIPRALNYNTVQQPTPADLQLVSLMNEVSKQIAIATGMDPEEVGVNVTSRVYQNDVDRRKNKINEMFSPFIACITQRLTMPDVTKRGTRARFNLDDYLRADPLTRMQVEQGYVDMGAMTPKYVASVLEGLPPNAMPAEPPVAPAPQTPVSPATIAEINSAVPSSGGAA